MWVRVVRIRSLPLSVGLGCSSVQTIRVDRWTSFSVSLSLSLSLSLFRFLRRNRQRQRRRGRCDLRRRLAREATMRRETRCDAMPALFWSAAFIGRRWLHVPVRPKTLEREERVEVKLQKSQTTQLRCQIIVCQRRRRESIFPQYWGRASAHYTGMD